MKEFEFELRGWGREEQGVLRKGGGCDEGKGCEECEAEEALGGSLVCRANRDRTCEACVERDTRLGM